ncbi:MAG TPA: hypothetical protein VFM65_01660 [Flavobacteriaceae bacterium]|nr:hypothetical protein [Flavobacteriaceae bacterium]
MKKPISILLLLVIGFICSTARAQDLNTYKYVIVPVKYDFLNEKDQYQLNSLTEFLLEKHGFTAILEGEKFPEDLLNNRCAALNVDVLSDSGFFSFVTRVKLILKNCNNQVVFESKQGKSRLKKRKFAYQEALRDAFSSVKALGYSYSGKQQMLVEKNSQKTIPIENPKFKGEKTSLHFLKNGKEYELEKQEKSLVLKKMGNENPVAFLNETSTGSFIFRSGKINGSAYFDDAGNLIVEYFDEKEGKIKKLVYSLKN